ncbi:DUF3604 domain-containing protein [Parahaliea mediterranea]|uniref:DUF3604 domain-containing protein n=1 Tax=Parahaliea mediterranea TaxID=651086 RepID=UPI000E2F0F21|nr:DUF3604 domain-containing protein [Parahaliea mediterranea]
MYHRHHTGSNTNYRPFALALACAAALGTAGLKAAEPATAQAATASQATAGQKQLLWGDTHLHTSQSTDAFGFGVRLELEQAFRFARGETVTSSHGLKARLDRPLDFLLVADHAESLGIMQRVYDGDPEVTSNETAAHWHEQVTGSAQQQRAFQAMIKDGEQRRAAFTLLSTLGGPALHQSIWQDTLATAERFNQPGEFTALLGYEWTAGVRGNNLHRVIMYRDDAATVGQIQPFSQTDSSDPRELWDYMAGYERDTGGQVLAIPHNGNLSNGVMFPVETTQFGAAVDADYAANRRRWEPVYEVTQMKGDGETHPLLSPDDEFADYETWDRGNFFGLPKTEDMLPAEYARSALKSGLAIARREGVNPYQFGMIGSTDSHTGLSTADEDNFFGKHSGVEPDAGRWQRAIGSAGDWKVMGWEQTASGMAAVWASDNTREAIWDAFKRREVYATTGPRIAVRLFAGWHFDDADVQAADLAARGYAGGTPMGGTLSGTPEGSDTGTAPRFLVAASRDPQGANLDRIQIVKGWIDAKGDTHEQVYDVSWSSPDSRQPGADGKLPPVGNTVDVAAASWSNTIGTGELATVWQDPDFDPSQAAFYYARVLQIPTPRWTAYDAKRYNIKMDAEVPMITVERAYTSPIWYQP